jgi:hypothetical protein
LSESVGNELGFSAPGTLESLPSIYEGQDLDLSPQATKQICSLLFSAAEEEIRHRRKSKEEVAKIAKEVATRLPADISSSEDFPSDFADFVLLCRKSIRDNFSSPNLFVASRGDVVKLNDLIFQALAIAFSAYNPDLGEHGFPIALISPPGQGKTEMIRQFGEIIGYGVCELQLEQIADSVGLTGMVIPESVLEAEQRVASKVEKKVKEIVEGDFAAVSKERVEEEGERIGGEKVLRHLLDANCLFVQKNTLPQFAEEVIEVAKKNDGKVILVLDEVFAIDPRLQVILQTLVQEKRIGTIDFRDSPYIKDLKVVITTNKPGVLNPDSIASPTLVNRLCLIDASFEEADDRSYGVYLASAFELLREFGDSERRKEIARLLGLSSPERVNPMLFSLAREAGFSREKLLEKLRLAKPVDWTDPRYLESFATASKSLADFYAQMFDSTQSFEGGNLDTDQEEVEGGGAGRKKEVGAESFIVMSNPSSRALIQSQKRDEIIDRALYQAAPFDTYRSLSYASCLDAACAQKDVSSAVRGALLAGCLGQTIGREYSRSSEFAFLSNQGKRIIEKILADPSLFGVGSKVSIWDVDSTFHIWEKILVSVVGERLKNNLEGLVSTLGVKKEILSKPNATDELLSWALTLHPRGSGVSKEKKREIVERIKEVRSVFRGMGAILERLESGEFLVCATDSKGQQKDKERSKDLKRDFGRQDLSVRLGKSVLNEFRRDICKALGLSPTASLSDAIKTVILLLGVSNGLASSDKITGKELGQSMQSMSKTLLVDLAPLRKLSGKIGGTKKLVIDLFLGGSSEAGE